MSVDWKSVEHRIYTMCMIQNEDKVLCKLAHYFRIPFSNYFERIRK
ncbi:hypothetical protein GK0156 [Geobacillus kaustophilus HTA426]|uniref:Uncharacterized protein n=1 Tax=Geobacillus kaustophilus (strain HTA426) TaxID=235909 RepID=Q5L3N9_GEOKA|nr:hypothetical protein GK0156 [Geobacillus kaustophilus HTA426]